MAPLPPVLALVDDVVEEILLRCPPDDPARLVRAALVCRGWRGLVSGPRFRRRFRDRHRAAPLLGFLYCRRAPIIFESTAASSFRPRLRGPPNADPSIWRAIDARHGRVLVRPFSVVPRKESLFVWCPVTGDLRALPMPQFEYGHWTAALLCAAAGCDHLDCGCGCGPFTIVFVGTDKFDQYTSVCVYSSEASAWSDLTSVPHIDACINKRPSVLLGNAVYFMFERAAGILKLDLVTRELSVIKAPPAAVHRWFMVLTTAEEGGLRLATITNGFKLILWSIESGSDAGWVQSRVIELKALLPAEACFTLPEVVGFADGVGVVLVRTSGGFFFTVDIKSGCVKKIGNSLSHYYVIPYMNFCTPGPRAGASTVSQTEGADVLPC